MCFCCLVCLHLPLTPYPLPPPYCFFFVFIFLILYTRSVLIFIFLTLCFALLALSLSLSLSLAVCIYCTCLPTDPAAPTSPLPLSPFDPLPTPYGLACCSFLVFIKLHNYTISAMASTVSRPLPHRLLVDPPPLVHADCGTCICIS